MYKSADVWIVHCALSALFLLSPAQAHAQEAARELRVDTANSHIYVVTHRSGIFSFLGHEHAIVPSTWSATICFDSANVASSSALIVVDTRTLVIDSDEGRRLAGLGSGPSPSQREQIQRKMLDAAHLDAENHSELRFETSAIALQDDRALAVHGRLTIRGVTRDVHFPATLERLQSGIRINARLTVKQSDFGIKPESVRGVVKVSDPVDIHMLLEPDSQSGAMCSPTMRQPSGPPLR